MVDWRAIDENKHLLVGIIVFIAIFSLFYIYYCVDYYEADKKYNTVLMTLPETKIDMWSVSHLLLYVAIGLLAPNYYVTVLIGSVIWEYLEKFLNKPGEGYWYHKWDDLLINIIGYIIGSAYRNTFTKIV